MTLKALRHCLLILLLALMGQTGWAETLRINRLPSGPLGAQMLYLQEQPGQAMTLEQARAALEQGYFRPDPRSVASFGIGARPVWMVMRIDNSLDVPVEMRLEVGMSWLDHVEVFHVQGQNRIETWNSGDEAGAEDGASAVMPGQGFTFPLRAPAELSEVFIRVESVDPMVLPVRLELDSVAKRGDRAMHYAYGMIYGYLIALIAYNLIVFFGLRKGSYLLYALHLSCFIALNLAYTGHGYALWWGDQAHVQRYATLACMVAWGISGLAFASRFLGLRAAARKQWRLLYGVCAAVVLLAVVCTVFNLQFAANVLAFSFLAAYELSMLALGLWALQQQNPAARYFTAAAVFGLVGGGSTLLAVAGVLPVTPITLYGVEVGVLIEATLLALALARDIRSFEEARHEAEVLASIDTLTGLLNRRAFGERAHAVWNTAARRTRPLTAVMVDLDHFKVTNDEHGHAAGDEVLKAVAGLLSSTCRTSDVIARWGGEEFLLLLPETTLEQGIILAERLRSAVEACEVVTKRGPLKVTASFGMADLRGHPNLDSLIADADQWLYRAKHAGRNRVMGPPLAPPLPPIEVRDSAFTVPDF